MAQWLRALTALPKAREPMLPVTPVPGRFDISGLFGSCPYPQTDTHTDIIKIIQINLSLKMAYCFYSHRADRTLSSAGMCLMVSYLLGS